MPQDDFISPFEADIDPNGIDSDDNSRDVQSASRIPSPDRDLVGLPTSDPTKPSMAISFLCNPNDEHPDIRQISVSDLFSENLNLVQKRSWAKDSTSD